MQTRGDESSGAPTGGAVKPGEAGSKRAASGGVPEIPKMRGFAYAVSSAVAWTYLKVWHRLSRSGAENVPTEGPLLIVCNHASYLDPPAVGSHCVRRVRFIAKHSLGKHRIMNWWLQSVGVVLINQSAPAKSTLRTCLNLLAAGQAVAIFPEGERTEDGLVRPFEPGLAFLAKRSGASILPVGLHGSWRAMPPSKKFPRPRKLRMKIGQVIPASEYLAPGGADRLRATVAGLAGTHLVEGKLAGAESAPESDST